MASRRQAKKKGKAAKNAEHGNVQASAVASRKKTPQEEIQQADGVQPFLETPEHTEATAKGKSTQVPAPENNALTGETLSMSSGASETESSGDAAQDNAGGAAAPQTKEEAPRKTAAKPDAPDDLKLISGVGPKIEGTLHELGIFTFAQVAGWKKAEREWVDGYLNFKGRIERDDWVKQAKALAKGGEAEYIKVFGKKPR